MEKRDNAERRSTARGARPPKDFSRLAQAVAAQERTRITEELYLFSHKLAGVATLDDLLWTTVHQIALMLKVRGVVLLPEDGGLNNMSVAETICEAPGDRRGFEGMCLYSAQKAAMGRRAGLPYCDFIPKEIPGFILNIRNS